MITLGTKQWPDLDCVSLKILMKQLHFVLNLWLWNFHIRLPVLVCLCIMREHPTHNRPNSRAHYPPSLPILVYPHLLILCQAAPLYIEQTSGQIKHLNETKKGSYKKLDHVVSIHKCWVIMITMGDETVISPFLWDGLKVSDIRPKFKSLRHIMFIFGQVKSHEKVT